LLGEIQGIDEELSLVDAVTAEDVRRVANLVLRSPIQGAVIGPFTRETPFLAAIDA
jgi:predicted Zn-dependent peptidase